MGVNLFEPVVQPFLDICLPRVLYDRYLRENVDQVNLKWRNLTFSAIFQATNTGSFRARTLESVSVSRSEKLSAANQLKSLT